MFGIEKYYDGIRYLHISPKHLGYGYDISIYRILLYRLTPGMMSRNIAICHAISHKHRINSKHQANPNSTKTHHLVAVYSCFFPLYACPHLGLSSVWLFLSFFCCPPGHIIIIGPTLSPANSNLVPSGLGLLPKRMYVCFCSIFHYYFSFFPCLFSFLIPGTIIYSGVVVARYPIYYCC